MPATPPLDGVRVLDLASVGPAARASRWLADYGAEVVKVGPVPRHDGVQVTPAFHAYSAHRGMQRALFDLKADAGRSAFLALAAEADVVIESFRPGVVDRLGIGYAAVNEANPGIVYCSTSGYGQDGERSRWAGHDLNYLAVAGYLHCGGRGADGGPAMPGATVADSAGGGMQAVMAILAALYRRQATGEGAYLDVSVADGVLSLMSLAVDELLAGGDEPGPGHGILTGRYACYGLYQAGDGGWLAVGVIEPHFWANLCRALGCEDYVGHQFDDDRQDEIRAALAEAFSTRDRDEWVAELGPADTCVSAVQSIAEVVDDPQYAARGAFVDAEHPTEGEFRQVGAVLAGQELDPGAEIPDMATTATEDLLRGVGYDRDELDRLVEEGVVA